MTRNKEKEWTLFGHPIRSTFRLTLAEQVYDALCREIHSGRWKVGDRLPGASALADMSGLSHNVVQRALESLREDGYVRQEKRKGTFLKSILPEGVKSKGVIGIAMTKTEESSSYHFDHVHLSRLHSIIKKATELGYTTEVMCQEEHDQWELIDHVDGPFGNRVKGIICLHPFEKTEKPELGDERIPMVFMEAPQGICTPVVYHDGEYAIYEATRMAIEAGHTEISMYAGKPHPDCGLEVSCNGYRRAMRDHGLVPNEEAIHASISDESDDMANLREFIVRFSSSTAILTITSAKARRFVSVCDVLGIRISQDLSLLSQASAPMRLDENQHKITGMKANMERTVTYTFQVLEELINHRRSSISKIVLKPEIVSGHTLGPPRVCTPDILSSLSVRKAIR